MSATIKKRKLFWIWQDEKEEAWLHQMSLDGYHLVKLGLGSYEFKKGEPKNYVYRLDYRTSNEDLETYVQLFTDAGWEYLGELLGWQYFRIEAPEGEAPEIFTDPESKIQKYRRVETIMAALLPIYIVFINIDFDGETSFEIGANLLLGLLFLVLTTILVISFYKIETRIRELKAL